MKSLGWALILSHAGLAYYAMRTACRAIRESGTGDMHDHLMTMRSAFGAAVLLLSFGIVLYIASSEQQYSVVMQFLYLGFIASAFCAGIAIKLLKKGTRGG